LAAVPSYSPELAVGKQLEDLGNAGSYASGDMLLVNGGGNDAADLTGAFLLIGTDGGASYTALLGTKLSAAEVQAAAAGGQAGLVQAGVLYMQRLATQLTQSVTTHALNKGARRVIQCGANQRQCLGAGFQSATEHRLQWRQPCGDC
jgi:hypothetical protein